MTTQRTLQAIQQMENLQNLYTAASIGIISPEELEAQLRKIHDTSESSQ
ncbi:MAG: hypothetical protein VKJ46_15790 [Leptolyngbyaceae bacterium]|nr:hypothetical protein [Leptolyngbyaceae bacterium]